MTLSSSDFPAFFTALYEYPPMTWQVDAANRACKGEWHDTISLPTGAGKTSTIDMALFALAVQADLPAEERTAPMRTFLVVDRRTVVNEAFRRAEMLQGKLCDATDGVLKDIADRLRSYGGAEAVAVGELRGGIYRDPSWCNSLIQPMIVTSTVDQVGSRLLFRGYGVSNSSRPMQAAAIAHDSLVILDEAHISRPFAQTLQYIQRYQQPPWSGGSLPRPMRVIEMTATPQRQGGTRLEIAKKELKDKSTHIGRIVNAPKSTTLEVAEKVKGAKAPQQLGKRLAEIACEYVFTDSDDDSEQANNLKVVGVMVNTVATAKEAYKRLCANKKVDSENVHLIIGSMRSIDREEQMECLRKLISTGRNRSDIEEPIFVVSTQCIEVGADYDFDALITEAAPLSSLRQRFGRLNRAGREDVTAQGHILMRGDRVKTAKQLKADDNTFKMADPIYGNALSYTWNWLSKVATDNTIDFGIASFDELSISIDDAQREQMTTNQVDAPVLLPAHLDLLCQTSLDPHPNPSVSVWLHGPERNDAEVQVCWRADLISEATDKKDEVSQQETVRVQVPKWSDTQSSPSNTDRAIQTVSLCPPTAAECMSVRLVRVKKWLASLEKNGRKTEADPSADIPAIVEDDNLDGGNIPDMFCPIAWRGSEHSQVIARVNDIRPGDTLVFNVLTEGWNELGVVPGFDEAIRDDEEELLRNRLVDKKGGSIVPCRREDFERVCQIDEGTKAFTKSRNRPFIRIHPALSKSTTIKHLRDLNKEGTNWTKQELIELVALEQEELAEQLNDQPGRPHFSFYDSSHPNHGLVISGKTPARKVIRLSDDDGEDLYSRVEQNEPIPLGTHSDHVLQEVETTLRRVTVPIDESLRLAATYHDWGKADARFQAILLGGDLFSAYLQDTLLAKSDGLPTSRAERKRARQLSQLPDNFRHEFLSMSLIEAGVDEELGEDPDLLLHVVAAHHGYARPWAPRCDDLDPPDVSLDGVGRPTVSLSAEQRVGHEYDAIDSAIVKRFWNMNQKYGWWGLAFLESILRFADRRASQIESQLQARKKPAAQEVVV